MTSIPFICPRTAETLHTDGDRLACTGHSYPVVDGIARFIGGGTYADAFGLQWNEFAKTQFDSFSGSPITEERLALTLGFPLSDLAGKHVLEAGSGAGRFTEILLKHGAKVWSFDLSSAVDANARNNWPNEDLVLFQGDIRRIPFAANTFDLVICLGVLQHTPSTQESLIELARVLKTGGTLATDHYRYQLGMFTSLYLVWWFFIKRLAPSTQIRVTDWLTSMFFPLHWSVRNNRFAQMLLRRVSPINFYYGVFDLPKDLLYEWSRLDTHDRNTDHFKRHVTRAGYASLLRNAGISTPDVFEGGTGYVGRGKKTAPSA